MYPMYVCMAIRGVEREGERGGYQMAVRAERHKKERSGSTVTYQVWEIAADEADEAG